MGARGPKAKPNAVKLAAGTRPSKLNKGEVAAPLGIGPAPASWDDGSKALWDRIVAEAPPNVLTVADRLAVEEWIKVSAELTECRKLVREHTMLITETRGTPPDTYTITKANPLLPTLTQLRKQWVAFADRFGFTASARASLAAEAPKPPSKLAEFMANRGKTNG